MTYQMFPNKFEELEERYQKQRLRNAEFLSEIGFSDNICSNFIHNGQAAIPILRDIEGKRRMQFTSVNLHMTDEDVEAFDDSKFKQAEGFPADFADEREEALYLCKNAFAVASAFLIYNRKTFDCIPTKYAEDKSIARNEYTYFLRFEENGSDKCIDFALSPWLEVRSLKGPDIGVDIVEYEFKPDSYLRYQMRKENQEMQETNYEKSIDKL